MLATLDIALMKIELVTARLAGLVIFLIMLLVSAEVFLRRLFNSPIPGQVDITMMSMVAFSVLCISYCYRQAGHIRMNLLVQMTQGRMTWVAQLFVTLMALLLVTSIVPGTWTHFHRAYAIGDTTFGIGLPTWPSKLVVPVGLGILWLRLVLEVWVFGRLILRPTAEPIGVPRPPDPLEDMDA